MRDTLSRTVRGQFARPLPGICHRRAILAGVDRRNLLRAAVAAPAAGLAGPALGAAGAHAAPSAPDPDSPRFAIAVLPDTQYLFDADSADPEPLRATTPSRRSSSSPSRSPATTPGWAS